ncbi:MAG: hypothetical protein SAL07_25230 [Oscillatoria sp. PMC 1051.18]|nr:hypothetical protein [Oscillatoria sp. PMC 1050.18]MEC5033210.1 hypothetical protein [Oscillatoria sp. PMC 1051.18]
MRLFDFIFNGYTATDTIPELSESDVINAENEARYSMHQLKLSGRYVKARNVTKKANALRTVAAAALQTGEEEARAIVASSNSTSRKALPMARKRGEATARRFHAELMR